MFAALAVVSAVAACTVPPDPYWLTGNWRFETDSEIILDCGLPDPATESLEGVVTRLIETSDGFELDLGCSCRLQMSYDGHLAQPGQDCKLVVPQGLAVHEVSAVVDVFTLTAPDGRASDVRQMEVRGLAQPGKGVPITCNFSIKGGLARTKHPRPRCGPPGTAVGVLPYYNGGLTPCPVGAGVDGLRFMMGEDNRTGCRAVPTDVGDPPWTLPDAPRRLPACDPTKADGARTWLPFCKVDGQLFEQIVGFGRSNSYALLQLGEECPEGSVSVQKRIDNDDDTQGNGYEGDIFPNQSTNDAPVGTATILNFCIFRGIQEERPSIVSFPELGFPYAVFHPFDGPQPTWVISKRWIRTDDESADSNGNAYTGPGKSSGGAAVEELKSMILDVDTDTIFDLARVR